MKKRFNYILKALSLACLLIIMSTGELYSQHPGSVNFWHLTPDDGLSQSTGKTIYQDYKGYMWIGTQDGLNKYDGHEITVYKNDAEDSTSIGYNDIGVLFEDRENNFWIGTLGGGLNLYKREMDQFSRIMVNPQSPEKGLTDNTIFALEEDDEGNLWIGTNNGLNVKPKGQNHFLHYFSDPEDANSIDGNYIEEILNDSRGNIWIGTITGLTLYNPDTNTFTKYNKQLGSVHVQEIYETRDGVIWIGTEGGGLFSYHRKDDSFVNYTHDPTDPTSISDNSIFSILEDSRGVLWIGTENNGLDAFDRSEGVFYHYNQNSSDPTSLNNNAIYSLYENDDQLLWVGTFAGGINILDRKIPRFEHYKHNPYKKQSLGANSILSFLEDSRGNFWVGTDGGDGSGLHLFNRRKGTFKAFRHNPSDPKSIPSNVILDMLEDRQGYLWIGFYNGGVSRFDYQNFQFNNYKHNPETEYGLTQNNVFALLLDSRNQIWAGTNGEGVNILGPDRKQFQKFGDDSVYIFGGEINLSHVRSFLEDANGNIWIGTYGSGVVRYNPQTKEYSSFHIDNSNISNSVIIAIFEDSKKRLWLGSKGGGLNLFNPGNESFTHYTTDDGLPSNVINGILEDDKGNLWLSTHDGISKFNPEQQTTTNYGQDDGLQSREFNPGAYYKDRQGYFYFGGINGFNRFHPDSIKPDTTVYPLYISDFEIFNHSVEPGENSPLKKHISEADVIYLNHNQSVLTFEYATLNYNEEKGHSYAYKMDGFDADWNHVGERRSATYTNLDPGEYIFRVKAANSDNYWSDEATVKLVISPPFWRTIWFYMLVGGIIILIGFSWYRMRVRSIQEHNKRLEEEVRERTSELNQRNRELKQTLQDLEATREELVEQAHKAGMADIATGVLHNVGNILNSVNTSSALIDDTLQKSKISGLEKANEMLRENLDQIEMFFSNEGKGRKLLDYYLKLEEPLKQEHQKIIKLSERLSQKIRLINEVIAAQQSYATITTNSGTYNLAELVDEAIMLNAGSAERHDIHIEKNYRSSVPVVCQRTKLIHVLVNIYNNAKEAMAAVFEEDRKLIIDLWDDDEFVYLSLSDNGHGITKENLGKIFNQGFSTKAEGHGFGLHSSANYIKEMGGEISVESDGEGKGAKFVLKFKRAD